MAEKNKTSLFTWLVLILIVLGVYASTLPDRGVTASNQPLEPSQFEKIRSALNLTFKQKTLASGLLNVEFTITNNSDKQIKDIAFRCSELSKSNTVLGRNVQTVYEVLPAGATGHYVINMGPSHPQAHATQCVVMNFEY
ncbi:hypothetical protein [Pseudoalteromonas rhizosphaerae]|uniref:hypothetical protein n=1 Tax=Pseudoalteromonas rhizosphaerae TaxID=2518973 RepID=UPI001230C4E4|nr:hypothetical protein [Pseudoalteromonas rhizosphaerae]